jgi:cation diffusion facilitator family transporter
MIIQIVGGILSGSIAIFADTAHLASDNVGFVIALLGVKYSQKAADEGHTFGWHRAELIGSLISVVSIWIMTIWLFKEATDRIILKEGEEPPVPKGPLMFTIAVIGLGFNIVQICLLGGEHGHGHSHGGGHGHSHAIIEDDEFEKAGDGK